MGLFSFLKPKGSASREEVAEQIVWHISKTAFAKFREEDFRQKLQFERMEQEERDRIFNELVITGLALAYLTLEIGENLNKNHESQATFRNIKNNLASGYVNILRGYGVEDKKLLDLWYQLLAMRCEEYRKDFRDHKQMFTDPRQNHWVHICAIGGSDHICRGVSEKITSILPQITRWCAALSVEMQRIIAKNALVVGKDGKPKNVKIDDSGKMV